MTPSDTKEKSELAKNVEDVFGGQLTKSQLSDMGLSNLTNLNFEELSKEAEQVVLPGATNKAELVGVPFVILAWMQEYSENFQAEYVKVALVTENNEPKTFVDFGTGIGPVLVEFERAKGSQGKILCSEGLRRSDYDARIKDDGTKIPGGTTYYLT